MFWGSRAVLPRPGYPAQRRRGRWCLLKFDGLAVVPDHQNAVDPFQDIHPGTGIAGPACSRQQLQYPQ